MFDEQGRQLATSDSGGTIRIWSLERDPPELTHTFGGRGGTNANVIRFNSSGSMLAAAGGLVWDFTAPPGAEPVRLLTPRLIQYGLAFHPDGSWLATTTGPSVSLWPVARTYPRILRGHEEKIGWLAFTPDSERLVSTSGDGSVRVWPLRGGSGERPRILHQVEGVWANPSLLAMAPNGSFVATGSNNGQVMVVPLDGSPAHELLGFNRTINSLAVGPRGRLVAARAGALVRIWDLQSDDVTTVEIGEGGGALRFTTDGDLWIVSGTTLRRWRLAGDEPRPVTETVLTVPDGTEVFFDDMSGDGQRLLLGSDDGRLWIQDLRTRETRELGSHAGRAFWAWMDPTGEIVVSVDAQEGIRVGSATGDEPHLVPRYGGGIIGFITVSPDRRWIATGSADWAIRLWPIPDLSKPPLHTLPRDELIGKLRTLTNMRAVRDAESPTGWKIEAGPFPGWETVPTW
jgi:WD40 repeat protein